MTRGPNCDTKATTDLITSNVKVNRHRALNLVQNFRFFKYGIYLQTELSAEIEI
jgi:hypothetical protein